MRYEYQPYLLQTWVKTETRISRPEREWTTEKYKSRLEKIKEAFQAIREEGPNQFEAWFNRLTRREKLLLPYLYEVDFTAHWKQELIRRMQKIAAEDRRMFRAVLDSLYETCDMPYLWEALRYSYARHMNDIEKRMREKGQSQKWRDFLMSKDPISFLAAHVLQGTRGMQEELDVFYLSQNVPFFKPVFLEIVNQADATFFQREKELYKTYFAQVINRERQQMAHSLIRNCERLSEVKDLALFIYNKHKTYRRKPMLWNYVGEPEKSKFARWILRREIKDFFGSVNQNHERYVYWKKFIGSMEDAVVTDQRKTLIMYFPEVVIMEVLGTGAVYVYDAGLFQRVFQSRIDKMLEQRERSEERWIRVTEVKRSELMDQSLVMKGGWLRHHGSWQWDFDRWLQSRLGWEVDANVLSQKEERDEDDL